ncbi:MAG: hypothetical protein ACTSVU_00990 [Promethearchaeota archaeon]
MAEQIRIRKRKKKTNTAESVKEPLLPNKSTTSIEKINVKSESNQSNSLSTEQFSPFPSNVQPSQDSSSPKIDTNNFQPFPQKSSQDAVEVVSKVKTAEKFKVVDKVEKKEKLKIDITEGWESASKNPITALKDEFEALSPLEKEVVTIARSVLKKKRYKAEIKAGRIEFMSPLLEQLYSKCIAKLTHTKGYPKEDIFNVIQDLIKKFWIVTDQRRTRQEILESPTLKQVLTFIHDYPGTHARDTRISEEIGITRNPFIKHVMVLEAFGLVRAKKIGRTQNYFLADIPETFDDYVVLFTNPLVSQIITLLLQERIGLSEIARRLDVYHGAIQYHIKNLIKMDLIEKQGKNFEVNKELLRKYNRMYKIPPFHKYF